MLLLEFPTEVFAHVVFFVVTDLGVEEAMKARSVCRKAPRLIFSL